MLLTKHQLKNSACWAVDGRCLPPTLNLSTLLELSCAELFKVLEAVSGSKSDAIKEIPIRVEIQRAGKINFEGETKIENRVQGQEQNKQ
jgi:hypothetical protein